MTHINNHHPPTLGDENMDTREELTMKHSLDAPISTWKIPPQLYHDGYDYLSFYHPKFDDSTQILGLTDTVIDRIQADEDRLTVHLYEGANVQSLDITKGTHYVNKGAYVAHIVVANSVLYVAGHIGELIIGGDAQVFLYEPAYIDKLVVFKGGYVCVYTGASIYNMNVEEGGRCLMSDTAKVHTNLYYTGTIAKMSDPDLQDRYEVRIHVAHKDIIPLCKILTEQNNHEYGAVVFNDIKCWGAHGCRVDAMYNDPDPEKDDYIVSFRVHTIDNIDKDVERRSKQSSTLKPFAVSDVEVIIEGHHAFDYFLEEKKQREKDELDKYPNPYEGESFPEYWARCEALLKSDFSVADMHAAYWNKPKVKAPWDDGKYASDWDMPPIGAPIHDEEAWDEYHKKREQEKEQKKAAWKKEKRVEVTGPLAQPYPPTTFTSEDYMDSYPDIMIHRTEKKTFNTMPASKIIDLNAYRKEQQEKEKERRRADEEDDTNATGSPYNT